jgi:type IV secretion system protein TrbJ
MTRRRLILGFAAAASLVGAGTWLLQPASAIPVFDASNYAENMLTAARSLTQINNQIQALQNQAVVLQNMAKNLKRMDYSSVSQLTNGLQRVDALMLQAQGISYNVSTTNSNFQSLYPQQYASAVTTNDLVQGARGRWQESMNAYQQTMGVQSQVVQNVQEDRSLLDTLVSQSQGSEGALQAQQATNQLLALSIKQQLQIQNMMAAQYRADAAEQARTASGQAQGRAATKRFLGNSNAYTPK